MTMAFQVNRLEIMAIRCSFCDGLIPSDASSLNLIQQKKLMWHRLAHDAFTWVEQI